MQQLIIVSENHSVSDRIKDILVFENYDPIVVSSLSECVKAFNRGSFVAVLFLDYHETEDQNLQQILDIIIKKHSKKVIMENLLSPVQAVIDAFPSDILSSVPSLRIINTKRPNSLANDYRPQELLDNLREFFNQHSSESNILTYKQSKGRSTVNIELDTGLLSLRVNSKPVYITPSQVNLLSHFISNQGAILSQTDLILDFLNKNDIYIWSIYLEQNIHKVLELIGDTGSRPQFIKQIAGIGYYVSPES